MAVISLTPEHVLDGEILQKRYCGRKFVREPALLPDRCRVGASRDDPLRALDDSVCWRSVGVVLRNLVVSGQQHTCANGLEVVLGNMVG